MTVTPADEEPRDASSEAQGFSDAVTFAFADPRSTVCGVARVGLAGGKASGLAILFSDGQPAAVAAEGGLGVRGPGWSGVQAADISVATTTPLEKWTVSFDGDGDGGGFELEFEATSPPASMDEAGRERQIGGMHGYEQVCKVRGSARVGETRHQIRCLGQRGHTWGRPDWEKVTVARTITAWMEDRAIAVSAVRPSKADHHMGEQVAAFFVEDGGDPVWVDEPRLSTAYDAEGRQRRAGLELWVASDSEFPRRAAGEVFCGTTLDLGRLRLECAFFVWRMEGRMGVGRYDIMRRALDDAAAA